MNVRAPVFADRYANWIKGSGFSLNGCVNELTTNGGLKRLSCTLKKSPAMSFMD